MYPSNREPEYDYRCNVCGKGYYAEVGISFPPCGCVEKQPEYPVLKKTPSIFEIETHILDDEDDENYENERPW